MRWFIKNYFLDSKPYAMPGVNGNKIETNDCYIWHNYSAPAMTQEELDEMRSGKKIEIIYVFTKQNNEQSLAATVAERWSKKERNFSGRPLQWY